MPAPERRHSAGLMRRLVDEPYRFEFFQAVRLLGVHFRRKGISGEGAQREPISFGSSLSLSFPPSEIEALKVSRRPHDDGTPSADNADIEAVHLTPSFIGLTGNLGALPRHYTEMLAARELQHRDHTAPAFLDIFADRAVMQFYRAWLKYRLHFQYENDRRNRYLPILLSMAGLGSEGLRDRLIDDPAKKGGQGVLDESLAYYAGVLRNAGKSAQVVQGLLSDYLRVPVRLEQFVGRWFDVPLAQRTVLGRSRGALGAGALCGTRVWQRETRVRLEIGPLDKAEFDQLLPGGAAARSLGKLLALMTGVTLEYEVQLILRRDCVRPAQLAAESPTRLGLDGWMLTRPAIDHVRDACFEIQPQLH